MADRTLGEIVRDARGILQDTVAPYRYSDADLYSYLSTAMAEVRRVRPDFFLGSLRNGSWPGYTTASVNVAFPLDWEYSNAFVYFLAGRAELRDDEFTNDGRAGILLQQFQLHFRGA